MDMRIERERRGKDGIEWDRMGWERDDFWMSFFSEKKGKKGF